MLGKSSIAAAGTSLLVGMLVTPAMAGVPRVVVAEQFGQTGSEFSAHARCGLQMVEDEFADEFIFWENHIGDQYEIPEGAVRASWYGVFEIPDVRIDGNDSIVGAEGCESAYDIYRSYVIEHLAENGGMSPVEITGNYFLDFENLRAGLLFSLVDAATLTDLRATILVYEDDVDGQWSHVVRALYDEFVTLEYQYDDAYVEAYIPVDPEWQMDKISVVAYLQTISGDKKIYQACEVPLLLDFTFEYERLVRSVPDGHGTAVFDAVLTNIGEWPDVITVEPRDPFGDWITDFLVCGDSNPNTEPVELLLDPLESCEIQVRVHTDGAIEVRPGDMLVSSAFTGRSDAQRLQVYNGSHSLLLVDDDRDYDDEMPIVTAIEELGYLYEHWDAYHGHNDMTPRSRDLSGYDFVIWHHSWWPHPLPLSESDVQALMDYMDGGGALFLTSQLFLNDPAGPPEFITNYLGVDSFFVDPDPGYTQIYGVPDDPIGDGLDLPLYFPLGALATGDHLDPGPTANICLTAPEGVNVTVHNETGRGAKSVFMAVALNAVSEADPDPNNIRTILDRILEWLAPTVPIDPVQCSVSPWDYFGQAYVAPGCLGGQTGVVIHIRDAEGAPVANASVEIDLESCSNLCIDAPVNGLSGTTNAYGELVLCPRVGGCADCPIVLRANGVEIRNFSRIVSPDWDGHKGDGRVDDGDLGFFAENYEGGTGYHPCLDYNGNGATNPQDMAEMVVAYRTQAHNEWPCAGSPEEKACCFDLVCEILREEDCLQWGGAWTGLSTCASNPCVPPGHGACCLILQGGQCAILTETACYDTAGVWDGGDACFPDPCPRDPELGPACPPGGLDVFEETQAAFVFDVPGYGPRAVLASGPTAVLRRVRQFLPGGPCMISTEIVGLSLSGIFNPDCRDPEGEMPVAITLGQRSRSEGVIVSSDDGEGNPSFPDTSSFDVNVEVDIEGLGVYPHTVANLGNILNDGDLWDHYPCVNPGDPYTPPTNDHVHVTCPEGDRLTGCCLLGLNEFHTSQVLCESIGGTYLGDGVECPSGCVPILHGVPEGSVGEIAIGNITPNPSTGTVRITYSLDAEEMVRVDLLDASGRLVRTFPVGHGGSGDHEFVWDGKDSEGRDLPAGVYFLTLQTGKVRTTRGIVLLR